ncbi:unnamed protein product [Sphagnum jensenii]|uniref:F-box protein n=1 Tax=Sphagnum jensenii TaxID=128206 RepID=A0ABP0W9E4_9BRYO
MPPPPLSGKSPGIGGGGLSCKGLGNKIIDDDSWKPSSVVVVVAADRGIMISSFNDEVLLNILRRLSPAPHYALVCKRWMRLHGQLRLSIKVHDWRFLESGRMVFRFPNLTDVDLSLACSCIVTSSSSSTPRGENNNKQSSSAAILLTHQGLTVQLGYDAVDPSSIERCIEAQQLSPAQLDKGLKLLADAYPGLQRLCVVDTAGIARIAQNCRLLQELELYQCTDETLRAVSACKNLQIVRLIGSVTGFYHCTFTDIGLTIMSQSFRRLVKLELSGCEASYEGISAIGKCCLMLEELTLSNKGFYEGWVAALSFLTCLKTLRLEGCKQIDRNPGPVQLLGRCSAIERLHLERCDLRDRAGFNALLTVCSVVKELEFQDCWGLDDETLSLAANCKRVKLLVLEGCSLVTTSGVDTLVQAFRDLQRLRVTFCDNIRDSELSPALCDRVLTLKEFSWRPDTKSVLAAGLAGTGVGQRGGRFFRRA